MKSSIREELIQIVGENNYTDDEIDILSYSSDMGALPKEIIKLYGFRPPECILLPRTTEQIAAIINIANKYKVPVTPRGGASTGYGGSVPVNGGIVLDLTVMKDIIEVNEEEKTVTVQCGISCKELLDHLSRRNYHQGIYPSSAHTATIGGFVSMGGSAGIGAPKYGSIGKQVMGLKVVMPNGEILNTEVDNQIENINISSQIFVGTEGIMGIITEVKLRIYSLEESFIPCAAAFKSLQGAWNTVIELLQKKIIPHTLHLMDDIFLKNLKNVTDDTPDASALILATFEGSSKSVSQWINSFVEISRKNDGAELSPEVAAHEWANRYKIELLFKRLGPTLIPLEVLAPLDDAVKITKLWKQTAHEKNVNVSNFAILGDEQQILLMPMVLTDERDKGRLVKDIAILLQMLEASFNLGGKLYSIGVHNAPYVENKLGTDLEEYRKLKAELDPNNILNPFKVVRPGLPVWVFKPAMDLLAVLPSWFDSLILKMAGNIPFNDFSEPAY